MCQALGITGNLGGRGVGLGEMREEAATVTLVPETKAGEESGGGRGEQAGISMYYILPHQPAKGPEWLAGGLHRAGTSLIFVT